MVWADGRNKGGRDTGGSTGTIWRRQEEGGQEEVDVGYGFADLGDNELMHLLTRLRPLQILTLKMPSDYNYWKFRKPYKLSSELSYRNGPGGPGTLASPWLTLPLPVMMFISSPRLWKELLVSTDSGGPRQSERETSKRWEG